MSGRGPSPKDPAGRRRASPPARGEWVEIPVVNTKRPPKMPTTPRGGWAAGTKLAWKAWWSDGASTMWTPADVECARALAYLHHDLERSETRGKASLAAEVRQRMDGLGLTPKGKRDFRWRVAVFDVDDVPATRKPSSPYKHLRVVPDREPEERRI